MKTQPPKARRSNRHHFRLLLLLESEKLEIGNAILLSPLDDVLFEQHRISFDILATVKSYFHHGLKIETTWLQCLRIDQAATIAVTEDMKPYLQRHREKLK